MRLLTAGRRHDGPPADLIDTHPAKSLNCGTSTSEFR